MGFFLLKKRDIEFADVMREHAPTMRARLSRLGLSTADIDECMQDAFVKAWLHRDEMPSETDARRQWLGRVAFNASCLRRRELQRMHYVGSCDELEALVGESGSNTEAPAMLAEMLDRLPERYHEIVRLRAQGDTIEDIATHYGIPWTTAKSRWDRACVVMGARNG